MNANEMMNRLGSETNDHSEQSDIKVGETIEFNLKKVVDNFYDMNLKEELLSGIYRFGFEKPTPLQQRAILPCIMGYDVIVQSPQGTGKTTSVLISILQQIDTSLNECQALILLPTRKLAKRIKKMVIDIGNFLKPDCTACIGNNMNKLKTFPQVVVGTPNCVSNLINRNFLRTQFIKIFVLKKANDLLNCNKVQIKNMLDFLREDTQVILLSTQMSKKALNESTHLVSNPVRIFMQKEKLTLEAIKQFYINITKENETQNVHLSESKDCSEPLIDVGRINEFVCKEMVDNFHEMNLKGELLCGIYGYGLERPSPIQQHAILPCIMGHDVSIQSPPGTGKTTSVLISILQQIDTSLNKCQALILTPTDNLAMQFKKMVIAFSDLMKADHHVVIGRKNMGNNMCHIKTFPYVVVGTPSHISNLISRNLLENEFIKIFVLDEINNMLTLANKDKIKKVYNFLEKDTQVILLSNQMSINDLDEITCFLRNPVHILLQKEKLTLEPIKKYNVNITKENNTKNRHSSESNDYLGSLIDVGRTIESDWKEMVDSFQDMNLKEELLHGIYEYGFEKPLAIQQRAVLQCIKGHDVAVLAQSFSGKTTSVLISILQQIDTSLNESQALILVPSFELARQIQNVVIALGKFMKVDCHACTGNKNISDYTRKLDTFPHVVVGTATCVFDLIVEKFLQTKFIKIFVLDEVNILLSRDNKNKIKEVFNYLEKDIQVILLSNYISKIASEESTHFVSNPVRIFMHKEEHTLEVFKQSYLNISTNNETKNLGPLVTDDRGSIKYDSKELVDNFQEMNLKKELLRGIYKYGFVKPGAIQKHVIMQCIKGHDVIVQANSGTGKTTSVVISILQQIDTSLNECQALILTPSRKLALQIQKVVIAFGNFMKVECHVCIGKKENPNNTHKLDTFSHVVVGFPTCVLDLISKNLLQTKFIKIFILEDANELLSKYINIQIKEVFKSLEEDIQVILVSNCLSKKALDESTRFMTNPVCIFMHKEGPTLIGLKHFFVNFSSEECKFDSLCNLFDTLSVTQVVIFCNTRHKVEWLTECMRLKTFNVSFMHGKIDRQQCNKTLFDFRSGSIPIIITTYMFAKTIDVQQVSLVINYDLPSNYEDFVQRIERSRYVARNGIILNFNTEDKNLEIKEPINSHLVGWPITDYTNQSTSCSPSSASIPKDSIAHISVTKKYSGSPVTNDSGIIEYDWKEVVGNFHEMNLKEKLLYGIYKYGFDKPLAIQQRAILPCIKEHDVIIQAHSGTGKTTSVLISILQQIDTSFNECQALILTPSRKLALQIQKVVIAFGDFMKANCYACICGIKSFDNMSKLDTIPHVVVGTPTCVSDLIARKLLQTKFIKTFVLDETNKLLNRGIIDHIYKIFEVLKEDIQVILLSDPMSKDVLNVSTHFLHNPVHIVMQ